VTADSRRAAKSADWMLGAAADALPSGRPLLLERSGESSFVVLGGRGGSGDAPTPFAVRIHLDAIKSSEAEFASAITEAARSARTVVAWSGTLADEPFGDDPRTWLAAGHAAFARFCSHATATVNELGVRLLFEPHARHVLSDVSSTRSALRTLDGLPFGVALSPTSLLESSMLDHLDDHLTRIFEGLGPIADLLILDDIARSSPARSRDARPGAESIADDTAESLPTSCPLGTGALPHAHLLALIDAHVPIHVPIAIGTASAPDPISARAWIAG